MSIQFQATLRSKKLGVLIRDARLNARRTFRRSETLIYAINNVIVWKSNPYFYGSARHRK